MVKQKNGIRLVQMKSVMLFILIPFFVGDQHSQLGSFIQLMPHSKNYEKPHFTPVHLGIER